MSTEIDDLLLEYALGTLGEAGRARVEAALGSTAVARELDQAREALTAWAGERSTRASSNAGTATEPGSGSSSLRQRLLRTLGGIERFQPFSARLKECFDVDDQALATVLGKIDEKSGWIVAPFPGVSYFHFTPGTASGVAEAGVLRLAPGATFPMHRHLGNEVAFVLEGELRDRGQKYGPGSIVRADIDVRHEYQAGPLRDLVLISAHNGFEILSPPA